MQGVIAAGDRHTAEAGAAIFRQGGNAVDAAAAAAFAALVCEICVVNIGGGGFAMVVESGDKGPRSVVYDFFSTMPQRRDPAEHDFREIHVDFGGEVQPFFIGRASTAVPGVVAGLCQLVQERGTLPLTAVMAPAIAFAQEGFSFLPYMARILKILDPIYRDTPAVAKLFAPNGRYLEAGAVLRMPELGRSLAGLAQEGPDLFYRGGLARAIVRDHQQNGGLITAADLEAYHVLVQRPIVVDYRGFQVLLPPPSSYGGALIAFSLQLLETVSLEGLSHNGIDHLLALAHVFRLTSLARKEWEADPSRGQLSSFLSGPNFEAYAARLAKLLEGKVFSDDVAGSDSLGHTTHISALDIGGQAVSLTFSAGESGGYLVGDTGMTLNNMLGEHDLNPHGFHKEPPGARLFSMMSPAVVLKDGKPVLAVGSAGSNRLRSAILQTISNLIDFRLDPDEAINQARIHYESGVLQCEAGVDPGVAERLRLAGFQAKLWREKSIYFGGAQAAVNINDALSGGGDRRRGGAAIVV